MNIDSSIITINPDFSFDASIQAPTKTFFTHYYYFQKIHSGLSDTSTLTDDLSVLHPPKCFIRLYCKIKGKKIYKVYESILKSCEERALDLQTTLNDLAWARFYCDKENPIWERINFERNIISSIIAKCENNQVIPLHKNLRLKISPMAYQLDGMRLLTSCASHIQQVIQLKRLASAFTTRKFSEVEQKDWNYFYKNYKKILSAVSDLYSHPCTELVRIPLKESVIQLKELGRYFIFFEILKKCVSCPGKLLTKNEFRVIRNSLAPYSSLSTQNFASKIRRIINSILEKRSLFPIEIPSNVRILEFKYCARRIKELSLFFIGETIGEGGFKVISEALLINFQRSGKSFAPFIASEQPCVFAKVEKKECIPIVLGALQIYEKIIQSVPIEKRNLFVPVPSYSHKSSSHFEYLMPWFHGSLRAAISSKMVPLDRYHHYSQPLNFKDVLSILIDTCDALFEIHKLGYVHADVKLNNILIRKQDPWGGALNDWDLVRTEDYYHPAHCIHWSSLANKGYCSLECDGYGALIALGQGLFGEPLLPFQKKRSLILTSSFDEMLINFLNEHVKNLFHSLEMEERQKEAILIRLAQSNIKDMIDILESLQLRALVQEVKFFQEMHAFIRLGVEIDQWLVEELKSNTLFHEKLNYSFVSERESIFKAFFRELRVKIVEKWGINPLDVSVLRSRMSAMHEALSKK